MVRPILTYGVQLWAGGSDKPRKTLLEPLQKVQTRCIRQIAGAYKRTPTTLVEKETATPPLDLYVDCAAQQWAANTAGTAATQYIQEQV